jgi:PAS domain S-box-containing protein
MLDQYARERAILENLDIGVVVHAPDTSIVFNNSRASEILGLTKDQMMGKQAISESWKFLREDQSAMPLAEYPVVQISSNKKELKNLIVGINRPDTTNIRWATVNGLPILDGEGKISEIIISFADITENQKIKLELMAAKELAELASLAKSRFLDIAAHELRTPVTAFSLLVQLAQKQLGKGIPVDAMTLARMRSQADRITRLVIDLLDVSRLERNAIKLELQITDLVPVISGLVEDYNLLKPNRKFIFLKPLASVEIKIDAVRVMQVLSNFLDNACKYTSEDSIIEILLESTSNSARVLVKDYGLGISTEQLETLFNPFTRGSNELTGRSGGLGLGLYISRMIIELHGGKVGVDSKIGIGSTFYFEIPKNLKREKEK